MKIPRVGLLIESSRTYGRGILRGVAKYAHVHGPWSFFIQERELQSSIPDWLTRWRVQGVIARIEDKRTARTLQKLGCPVIDVLGNAAFEGIPAFDTDANAVAGLAADFLLKTGFRHFAYCGYRGIPFSDRRQSAFTEHVARQGHTVHVFSPRPSDLPESRIQAVELRGARMEGGIAAWLRKLPQPLALFACNDVRAQQVLSACRQYGLKVPEEIAVIGVDNDDVLCNLCEPPLTSIEPDTERIGFEAAALLDTMMQGQRARTGNTTEVPPARIVERASTDIVPIEDPIMVQAVRFIRDHINDGIAAKDVLRHVDRSRTDLEVRFHRWLKTSVRGEILRRRMERVRALLLETNLNLEQIAHAAGFSSAAHVCRLFQQHYGQTPSEYRGRNR